MTTTTQAEVQVPVAFVLERLSDAGAILDRAARVLTAAALVARGAGDLVVTQCAATDDDYTDRATITADHITWVACGHAIATK